MRSEAKCRFQRSSAWSSLARKTGDGFPAYCAAPRTTIAWAGLASSRKLHITTAETEISQTTNNRITAIVKIRLMIATTRFASAAAFAAAAFAARFILEATLECAPRVRFGTVD